MNKIKMYEKLDKILNAEKILKLVMEIKDYEDEIKWKYFEPNDEQEKRDFVCHWLKKITKKNINENSLSQDDVNVFFNEIKKGINLVKQAEQQVRNNQAENNVSQSRGLLNNEERVINNLQIQHSWNFNISSRYK